MKRKWLSLILVAVMLFSLASPAGAAEVGASPEDIVPSGIDSPPVAEDGTPTEGGAPPETEDETLPEEDSPPETADGLPSEGDASPGSGADLLPGAEAANEIAPQGMQLFSSASDFNIQGNKLVGYTGAGGAVDIPEGVEIIGEGAFKNKTAVTSITIPASVQTIENAAFMGSGLTNVTIPDNVVTLGYSVYKNGDTENATFAGGTSYTGVFTNCVNLTSVHIGAELSQIPPNTFNGCTKLTGVTIPNNITVVGTGAFLGCTSLASLSLPETLLTLGSGAFSKTELISVTIPGSVVSIKGCWYASSIGSKDNGVNAYNNRGVFMDCPNLASVTVQSGVTYIGENMFAYCPSLTQVNLPQSVTSIYEGAFYNCTGLSGIALPQNLKTISVGAFANSALTNITLPDSLETLGMYNASNDTTINTYDLGVFTNCPSLTSVNLGSGLTTVPSSTFKNCISLNNVMMNDQVISIGKAAFYNCTSLNTLALSETLEMIGYYAFYNALNHIDIPRSMTNIPAHSFRNSAVKSITIPDTVLVIDAYAFCDAALTSLIIPQSIVTIKEYAFAGSALTDVTLSPSVLTIEQYAFAGSALTGVTIPDNVLTIKNNIFSGCSNLKTVQLGSGINTIPEEAFYNCAALQTVGIPASVQIIKNSAFKNAGLKSITLPASVQTIENAAFMGSGLTSVTIPNSVVTLGYSVYKNGDTENATFAGGTSYTGVFTNCVNLTSVHIGAGLSQIPPNTFNGCTKLTGVTIPNNITVVGTGAFLGCTGLASVSLPETLLTLGSGAFSKTGLISVTIPGSVVSIKGCWYASSIGSKDNGVNAYNNRGVFMDCPNLASVTVQSGVTYIGENMFAYCPSLTQVNLPQSVMSIYEGAFYNCTGLSGIALPQNLKTISVGAFAKSALTNITLPDSLQTLGMYNRYNDTTVDSSDLGVFTGCPSLTSVNLGAGLTTIPSNTFKNCISLNNVTMNDHIISIGKAAFYGDSNLHNLLLPYDLAIIGNSAFYQVTGIRAYEGSPSATAAADAGLSVTLIPYAQKAVTPAANPSGGEVAPGTAVTLSSATEGASIRYTTDGGEPTESSALYSGAISITAPVTIKAKAFKSGLTASDTATFVYTVTITPGTVSVTGITLDKYTANLVKDSTLTLVASVSPLNATNQNVEWTSGNTAVATVVAGVVTGKSAGTADITATAVDGGIQATCTVTVIEVSSGAPAVAVGKAIGGPGDEVTVPVTLSNNPGIAGFTFKLYFDHTKLLPLELLQGPALNIGSITSNLQAGGDLSGLEFVTANWANTSNFGGNGVIYTVKFKIKEDAPESGVTLDITYDPGDVADEDYKDVDLAQLPGEIEIIRFIYGNIFSGGGDTSVNAKDAVRLAQHLAGWPSAILSPSERKAADVYRDDLINAKDAVKFAQYLAHWPGIVLGVK